MKQIEKIKNPSKQLEKELNKENIKIFQIEEISQNIAISLTKAIKDNRNPEIKVKDVQFYINGYISELVMELTTSTVYYLNKNNIPIDETLTNYL